MVDGSGLAEMVACELLFLSGPVVIMYYKVIQAACGSNPPSKFLIFFVSSSNIHKHRT